MSITRPSSARAVALAEGPADEPAGDLAARFLAAIGVTAAFGVISIHNMPILDAIHRQQRIRFVPARGEAGAMNMADAYARVANSLGVVITSTGTAAASAAGGQVEALTAGSPVLHITTQVDRPFMDRDRAAIHDVPRQPDMLRAISKRYYRIWEATGTIPVLAAAASAALSAPRGPVSVEIPIDVQREPACVPPRIALSTASIGHDPGQIKALVERARAARRPMLWLGGGARGAVGAATELVERGFCAVTSTNGRAIVAEDHPRSLGAFNMTPQAQAVYRTADLMIVAGSRLRGNETLNNRMTLPRPLVQIDADASQAGRNYPVDLFVHGEARAVLEELVALLPKHLDVDPGFAGDVIAARENAEEMLREQLGPYRALADALRARVAPGRHPFVRDVTVSNSTFGNRYVTIGAPNLGVHALGGGIGQGIAMAIGASMACPSRKTIALIGDGGAMVSLSELLTAVEEKAEAVFILMNDKAYGVIRNIQDVQYRSRHAYSAPRTPDFARLAASFGLPHRRVDRVEDFAAALNSALAEPGPQLLEVDMVAIGPFGRAFSGPPAGAAGMPAGG